VKRNKTAKNPKPKGKKTSYRTRNWKQYNTALINRGDITLWINPEVVAAWKAQSDGMPHKQKVYSDLAIEVVLSLKILFKLPLRAAQGLARTLIGIMKLELPCPHYSTLSRRAKTLKIDLGVRKTEEPIHLLVDSTGIKVAGEGEWKTRKWKAEYRRTWIKLHLGLDRNSGQIMAAVVTDANGGDPDHFPEILDAVEGDIEKVGADGIYDSLDNFRRIAERGAIPIIPARIGAAIRPEAEAAARNAVVAEMERLWDDETHDARWKVESGYHARSRVESEMFRYKKVIGDSVSTKNLASQTVEVLLGCRILNRFLELGRCESHAVVLPSNPVT
jgi:IS5 family transposase